MNIDWLILAEGHTFDSRGAITAVGLNQDVLIPERLPATPHGVILARISGDDLTTAETLHFKLVVLAPDGGVVFAQNGQAPVATPPLEVPPKINVAMDYQLTVTDYGEHIIKLSVYSEKGGEDEAQAPLWVVKPRQKQT